MSHVKHPDLTLLELNLLFFPTSCPSSVLSVPTAWWNAPTFAGSIDPLQLHMYLCMPCNPPVNVCQGTTLRDALYHSHDPYLHNVII